MSGSKGLVRVVLDWMRVLQYVGSSSQQHNTLS